MSVSTVKQLPSGKWGLFIDTTLISVALTQERIEAAQREVNSVEYDSYNDGHTDGYDEGYSDAEGERE